MDNDTVAGLAFIATAVLILALGYPRWLTSRARHHEPIEPVDLTGPDGPKILAALGRRAGIDRSNP